MDISTCLQALSTAFKWVEFVVVVDCCGLCLMLLLVVVGPVCCWLSQGLCQGSPVFLPPQKPALYI